MFAICSQVAHALPFAGHALVPLACGALWWPDAELLAVADLHLEKGSAFARQGWLVPPYDSCETLSRLALALQSTGARRVLVLGDSFHDPDGPHRLAEADRARLAALIDAADWTWIAGNHDGVSPALLGGQVADEVEVRGIVFRHVAAAGRAGPEVSGHFHPKARLAGGRGSARRCFALARDRLVLPAYGSYAGGLDIASPDLAAALGASPVGLLPTARGLVRLDCNRSMA